jgi:hypothetical protein
MTDNQPGEENLRKEFENLGKNLADAMRAAWDAPESKRLRDEVVNGLSGLGTTLRRESENLAGSPAAQQVKSEVGQIGERLRSTEAQTKVRRELLSALQTVNNELQKVIDRWSTAEADAAPPTEAPAETPAPEAAPEPPSDAADQNPE